MANKITKKNVYEALYTVFQENGDDLRTSAGVMPNEEVLKFIDNELNLLAKKNANGGSGKSKAQMAEDEYHKELVYNALCAMPGAVTVTELIRSNVAFAEFSTQKMSPILGWLIVDGKAEKTVVKGRNYYKAIV